MTSHQTLQPLLPLLHRFRHEESRILVLTGAGISAESGIPTFRGQDGFWTVGSRQFMPQDFATQRMFQLHPDWVWAFYLYRIGICRGAQPNAAHHALVRLERRLEHRFRLVTQNVDGLHILAGSSRDRVYQIHGDIRQVRCASDCCGDRWELAWEEMDFPEERDAELSAGNRDRLRCPHCGDWVRPHVLWFDECYDEQDYRFHSALAAAESASVLIVIGTSGATNLPMLIAQTAAARGIPIVEIGLEPSNFTPLALQTGGGFLQGTATELVPAVVAELTRVAG